MKEHDRMVNGTVWSVVQFVMIANVHLHLLKCAQNWMVGPMNYVICVVRS